MIESINKAVTQTRNASGIIRILTHHDTGGITSAAIVAKALLREDKSFKISVIKSLDKDILQQVIQEKNDFVFFLDFGTSMIKDISASGMKAVIFDSHELMGEIQANENVLVVNPHLFNAGKINASAISYLFAKELNPANTDLAPLSLIGMVGDYGDLSEAGPLAQEVLKSEDIVVKQSLRIFPATRPIHKALEFSSNVYIPGVSGSFEGVLHLLRDAKIPTKNEGEYRTLLDLSQEETARLIEAISARTMDAESIKNTFGPIYLVKFFSHLEDARELSMQLNACGRLGHGDLAISCCMGSKKAKFFAESIYITYKHMLLSGLKWININAHTEGDRYLIIQAGNEIKDTIIGTTLSIMANSFTYPNGTILIGMANSGEDRVKISSRIVGNERKEVNLQKIIEPLAKSFGGEGGGHQVAAGGMIPLEKQQEFVALLQKELDSIGMPITSSGSPSVTVINQQI